MLYDKRQQNLLREIVVAQFRLKDQATILGMLWSFLHPLLILVVLIIVFSHRGIGGDMDYYPIYLLTGIVPYTHFATATVASMHVLYGMRQLTGDTVFPKELLVFGAVLSRTLDYLVSLGICLLIALVMGVPLSWKICLLPFVVLLQLIVVSWMSLWLSFMYLYVRDVDHIFQVCMRILFFISPIFYPISFLNGGLAETIVRLNPLTHLLTFCRAAVLPGVAPPFGLLLGYFLVNTIFLFFSLKMFRKLEPTFAENI
jgi:ABC-type polysaccharide/polyol phosphate export permease